MAALIVDAVLNGALVVVIAGHRGVDVILAAIGDDAAAVALVVDALVQGAGLAVVALAVELAAGGVGLVLAHAATRRGVADVLGAGLAIVAVDVGLAGIRRLFVGALVRRVAEVCGGAVLIVAIGRRVAAVGVANGGEDAQVDGLVAGVGGTGVVVVAVGVDVAAGGWLLGVLAEVAAVVDAEAGGAELTVIALLVDVAALVIVLLVDAAERGRIALIGGAELTIIAVGRLGATAGDLGVLALARGIAGFFDLAAVQGARVLIVALLLLLLLLGQAAVADNLVLAQVVGADVPGAGVAVVALVGLIERVAARLAFGPGLVGIGGVGALLPATRHLLVALVDVAIVLVVAVDVAQIGAAVRLPLIRPEAALGVHAGAHLADVV